MPIFYSPCTCFDFEIMECKILIQKSDEDNFGDLSIFLLLFQGVLKYDLCNMILGLFVFYCQTLWSKIARFKAHCNFYFPHPACKPDGD